MTSPTSWVPAIVAVATVIANAAITHAKASRHEAAIADLEERLRALETKCAVIEERVRKGGGDA